MTLKDLNKEIAATYQSIAQKIEGLLGLLNEVRGEKREVITLARSILRYLNRIKRSVNGELTIAKNAIKKSEPVIISLEDLLNRITELQALIKLVSNGKSEDKIIRSIDITHKSILRDLEDQQKMIAKAA